jgi:hypothetical protein
MQGAMGVDAALARISQLESRFAGLAPARSATAATATGTAAGTTTGARFDQVLAAATASTDTGAPLTPARRLPAGRYGPLTPPGELAGYGNGRIPTGRLASLGVGDHQLWAPAATAFRQMSAAARADGVTIGVNDSYRDLGAQQEMARTKGLYSQGGLAAVPGTSDHGWGMALDLELNGGAQQWMRDNGWRFGFAEDVAREPWHWTYRPA